VKGQNMEFVEKGCYRIAKKPVTFEQFFDFVEKTGRITTILRRDIGSMQSNAIVSIDDALAYCEWAGYVLPTSNEWKGAREEFDFTGNIAEWVDDLVFGKGYIVVDDGNFVYYDCYVPNHRIDYIGFRCVELKGN
jgi:formylglycine-generating enzyme required for sulfatase activity